tara:strand:- start:104 stop:256 length:153 start_codon:yes stop_codon:yes gene_type:complete
MYIVSVSSILTDKGIKLQGSNILESDFNNKQKFIALIKDKLITKQKTNKD